MRLAAAADVGLPLRAPLGFGAPLLGPEALRGTRFERLQQVFELSAFDLGVVVVALARELDGRYEALFSAAQNQVWRGRPTVELTLNLLCADIDERLAAFGRFAPHSPLLREEVVRLDAPDGASSPRISAGFRLDDAVLGFVLGHSSLDERLAPCCKLISSAEATHAPAPAGLDRTFYVQAPDLDEMLDVVRRHRGPASFLTIDVEAALGATCDWAALVAAALRAADLGGHVPFFHGVDVLLDIEQRPRLAKLLRSIGARSSVAYLGGSGAWEVAERGGSVLVLPAVVPSHTERMLSWKRALEGQGVVTESAVLARLASTFVSLPPKRMAVAVADARLSRNASASARPVARTLALDAEALMAGARRQSRGALRALAERVQITPTLEDVILPAATLAQLRELAPRVLRRATVLDDWGFAGKRAHGRGTTVLFSGSSGTGKTFAAAAVASTIGQDLFRIDLAAVVSKYIGETTKNLARVFDAAERSDCVLLFDEADALFGKRSEVKDAHDRYANQEVAYLLQRVEAFGGLAILTTNLGGSIDEAFSRRLAMTVHFPIPERADRRRLWELALPAAAPRGSDLDLTSLAERFPVTGGVITKAALAAAFLAAEENKPIAMAHLLRALEREAADLGLRRPATSRGAATMGL